MKMGPRLFLNVGEKSALFVALTSQNSDGLNLYGIRLDAQDDKINTNNSNTKIRV